MQVTVRSSFRPAEARRVPTGKLILMGTLAAVAFIAFACDGRKPVVPEAVPDEHPGRTEGPQSAEILTAVCKYLGQSARLGDEGPADEEEVRAALSWLIGDWMMSKRPLAFKWRGFQVVLTEVAKSREGDRVLATALIGVGRGKGTEYCIVLRGGTD